MICAAAEFVLNVLTFYLASVDTANSTTYELADTGRLYDAFELISQRASLFSGYKLHPVATECAF